MSMSVGILFWTLVVLGYAVGPIALVWGWVRWMKRPKDRTAASILSLIGFISASASGVLGIAAILLALSGAEWAQTIMVRWCLLPGGVLSLLGLLFAIGGIWRRSALRWFAPAGNLATLAFWLLTTYFID
jgi:hypothetical protein